MIFLLTKKTNIHYSSKKLYNYSLQNTIIITHYNKLNLTTSPNFTKNILNINLKLNHINNIPQNLPNNLILLNLTKNPYLQKIKINNLKKYNNLQHFNTSHYNLKNIKKLTFKNNTNLKYLNISNNPKLTLNILNNITHNLKYSNITTLHLNKLQYTYNINTIFHTNYIKHLNNSHLKILSITSNKISYFKHNIFIKLPNTLKKLNIKNNNLNFKNYLFFLNNLKKLKILNTTFQNSFHLTKKINYIYNNS